MGKGKSNEAPSRKGSPSRRGEPPGTAGVPPALTPLFSVEPEAPDKLSKAELEPAGRRRSQEGSSPGRASFHAQELQPRMPPPSRTCIPALPDRETREKEVKNASAFFLLLVFLPLSPRLGGVRWERGAGGVRGPQHGTVPTFPTPSSRRYIVAPMAAGIDFRRYRKLRRFVTRVFLQVVWWDVVLNVPGLRRFRRSPLLALSAARPALPRPRRRDGGRADQARPVPLDARRHPAAGDHQRARRAPGRGAAGAATRTSCGRSRRISAVRSGEIFAALSPEPVGAASLAQVHPARLPLGRGGGREGAAAGDRRAGRDRPRGGAARHAPAPLLEDDPPPGGPRPAGRGDHQHHARRARPRGRGAERRALRGQLRGRRAGLPAQGVLGVERPPHADAGERRLAQDRRPRGPRPRRHPAARGGARALPGLSQADLRAPLRPCRPASGEPLRPPAAGGRRAPLRAGRRAASPAGRRGAAVPDRLRRFRDGRRHPRPSARRAPRIRDRPRHARRRAARPLLCRRRRAAPRAPTCAGWRRCTRSCSRASGG